MEFLEIDGSRGEGGGQILRSAASLSCISQVPVRITNIRKGRRVPGLAAQHLASVKVLAEICDAATSGLELGSTVVEFAPNGTRESVVQKNIGTAGSISLLLQGVIFAASIAGKRAKLVIDGGTDVPWSPTMNYTRLVLSGALERFGIRYSADVKRRGYYPRGGGRVEARIEPCKKIRPVSLTKRGADKASLLCTFSGLDRKVIESRCMRIADSLESAGRSVDLRLAEEEASDSGASVLLYSADPGSVVGIDSLWDGGRGDFARDVAGEFLRNGQGVDQNLADMLVIPASRCAGTSAFRTNRITSHLQTNLYVTSRITGCRYGIGRVSGGFEVRIRGSQSGIERRGKE